MAYFLQRQTLQTRWRRMVHVGLKSLNLQDVIGSKHACLEHMKQSIAAVVCYQQKRVSSA